MNQDFYSGVVHEWYNPLYRFALSLCKHPEDALDLTQNAFYKFSSKGDSLRDRSKVKSWLFSVLHREFVDQYRRQRRFPTTAIDFVPEFAEEVPVNNDNRVDANDVISVLHQMDERFRAPLTLFYLEHFSYKEIAEVLEIPIGTVMSRLRRGKGHLRDQFEKGIAQNTPPIPFPKEASYE